MDNFNLGTGQVRPTAESRYILPTFEERTAYGYKRQDPYAKLFEDRIIFLGVQIDDASADDVMAQLLVLESQDPDRDILMYINSPGGSFTAMTAIYDTMQYIRPQVQTFALGQAASAASLLLCAGQKGHRFCLPNSRIVVHQPSASFYGQAGDIARHAQEVLKLKRRLNEIYANHTGQTVEAIEKLLDRDTYLTPEEAKAFGLIDDVMGRRPEGAEAAIP